MEIGSIQTKAGHRRATLDFYATQRRTGLRYRRRQVRLLPAELDELAARILMNAPTDRLKDELTRRGSTCSWCDRKEAR